MGPNPQKDRPTKGIPTPCEVGGQQQPGTMVPGETRTCPLYGTGLSRLEYGSRGMP